MDHSVKVSVVLAVYNVENYLEQCLDSIVNQTLREIEIICINDGSTDNSLSVLRKYQERDTRIIVYSQSNSGIGKTREFGLSHARGEYLVFWDSDDYFDLSTLEKLYIKAVSNNADICICGKKVIQEAFGKTICNSIVPNKKMYPKKMPFNRITNPDGILNIVNNDVWNKLYRREFIERIDLHFLTSIQHGDAYFSVIALCAAERIVVIPESLVYYRRLRLGSVTGKNKISVEICLDCLEIMAGELRRRDIYPERSFLNYALDMILWVILRCKWSDYLRLYDRLKRLVLPGLQMTNHEAGYYYSTWREELLHHIFNEDAEEFLLSFVKTLDVLLQDSRNQKQKQNTANKEKTDQIIAEYERTLKDRNAEITELKNTLEGRKAEIAVLKNKIAVLKSKNIKLQELRNSWSYRIGRCVTWFPRKARSVIFKSKKR